jgi:hypothetical protein
MGNQQSTAEAISSTVNKSVTNVLQQNSSQCGQNNSGLQSVNFSNIKTGPGCSLGIVSSQKFSQIPSFSCLSNASQSSNLQAQLSSALKAAVQAETSGIAGALNSTSNSKTLSNMVNDISTNVNISNTATCLQNNLANQQAVFQAIESSCPKLCNRDFDPSSFNANFTVSDYDKLCTTSIGSTQELLQAATAACTSENTALTEAINKAAAEVSQIAKSETAGTDLAKVISNLFAGITGPIMYGIIGIVVVIVVVIIGFVAFSSTPAGQEAVSKLSSAAADKINNS